MGRFSGSIARWGRALILALVAGVLACDSEADGIWSAHEVRGLRLVPGDGSVTVHFIDPETAPSYVACWSTSGVAPHAPCVVDVTSPFELTGLQNGAPVSVSVHPRLDGHLGPEVEMPTTVPGSAERPIALHARMSPEDLDTLYERDVWSNELLPVDLWLGDEHGPVAAVPSVRGIRLRGWSSRSLPLKSYHIRTDERPYVAEYDQFNFNSGGRRASDRVLLTQLWTDPTGIRAPLAFWMFRELGHPAPSTYFVDWWLNERYEGTYVAVERVDREALRGWGLNRRRGGFTMVRDRIREHGDRLGLDGPTIFSIDPDTLGPNDEARIEILQEVFDSRGETDDHRWEEILELLRWVHRTPAGEEWRAGLKERFDVEALVDFMALMVIQYDTGQFRGDDDYWLYRDHDGNDLWRLIPWDMDRTFGSDYYPGHTVANDFFTFHLELPRLGRNSFFERTREALADRIDARIRELYLDTFTDAWWDAAIDELAAEVEASLTRWPEPSFERHPRQHRTESGWFPWHVEALRKFHRLRRTWFLGSRPADGHIGRTEGLVTFDSSGTAWLTDATGWVLAKLEGVPGQVIDLSVELLDNPGADGIQRQWLFEARGAPWQGEVTLYYRNRPSETWVPRSPEGELEVAGRNWELTFVEESRGETTWLPTRVNPFANAASAHVSLEGSTRLQLLYRR